MQKHKFYRCLALFLVLVIGIQSVMVQAAAEDTEIIYIDDAKDLLVLAHNCSLDIWSQGKTVILRADISLDNMEFEPVPLFGGSFEGNGHTISGLKIDDSVTPAGLFSVIQENGIVKNLNVEGSVSPSGTSECTGGVVGENRGTVQNVVFTGTVTGSSSTGGIAGINSGNGQIQNCESCAQVNGENMTGGIVGCNMGSVAACRNLGEINISNSDTSPGLEDINLEVTLDITRLSTADTTSVPTDTGGIAGYSTGKIENCSNSGAVGYPHIGYNVGGIVGRSCGYINTCTNEADIFGRKDVGGIAGQLEPNISMNYLTEETLITLRQQLSDLSGLVNLALEHAGQSAEGVREHLNDMLDYIDAAAKAADSISTEATIDSTMTGSGSAGGSGEAEGNLPSVDIQGDASSESSLSTETGSAEVEVSQDSSSEITEEHSGTIGGEKSEVTLAGIGTKGSIGENEQTSAADQASDAKNGEISDNSPEASLEKADINEKTMSSDETEALAEEGVLTAEVTAEGEVLTAEVTAEGEVLAAEEVSSPESAPGSQESASENQESMSGSQESVSENQESVSGSQESVSENQESVSGSQESVSGNQESVTEIEETAPEADNQSQEARDEFQDVIMIEEITTAEGSTAGESSVDIDRENNLSVEVTPPSAEAESSTTAAGQLQAVFGQENVSIGGSTAADGSVNTVTNITLVTPISQLAAAVSKMTGLLRQLNEGMDENSGGLVDDMKAINSQVSQITSTIFNGILGAESQTEESLISDTSDVNIDAVTYGKAVSCENTGTVDGDISIGGITGAMAIEYELDPEDDVTSGITGLQRRSYELKAIIQKCRNRGTVKARRSYAGSICGRMDLGLIVNSEAYGNTASENGSYVGGIAGSAGGRILKCYSKCTLAGKNYIGGIAGSGISADITGSGSEIAECIAHVDIPEGGQYIGAIAGENAGTFKENYFISDTLAGINRMSYHGKAEPLEYQELESEESVPEAFQELTLTFVAEEEVIRTVSFTYGESFGEEIYPEIPEKEGYYAEWDKSELKNLCFDTVVTAVYTKYSSALDCDQCREDGRPVFLVEGAFTEEEELAVSELEKTPSAFTGLSDNAAEAVRTYFSFLRDRTSPAKSISNEVIEQWMLEIPEDGLTGHTVRYYAPEGRTENLDIYIKSGNRWKKVQTETIGGCLSFSAEGNCVEIAAISKIPVWWVWILLAVLLILVIRGMIKILRKLLRRRTKRSVKKAK